MIEKLLTFPGRTENGVFTHVIGRENPFLEKTAAEYHPIIGDYIRNAKPIKGKTQILLTALGSGEYWGQNANGDYFPEEALAHEGEEYGYKTFVTFAKIYKHHVNKDPKASFGDVALSVYNPVYRRVELVVVLDDAKAPDIKKRIDEGDFPEWSMGCRVPWDECNICGNRAPTTKQYCEHLKYYIGRIHPGTGKVAYAINRKPRFFDISQVVIGADKIAKTLMKVASWGGQVTSSADLAEKSATINKEIPANDGPASSDAIDTLVRAIPEVKAREISMPTEILNDVARRYSLPEIMSTLSLMGIIPKPQEFQRMMLVRSGKEDLADDLDSRNLCFDPGMGDCAPEHARILGLSADNFNPSIMNMMSDFIPDRSYAAPHLARRIIIIEKTASDRVAKLPLFFDPAKDDVDARGKLGILPIMMLASGLYAALAKKSPELAAGSVEKVIAKHPGLAAALASAVPMIFNGMMGDGSTQRFQDQTEPEIVRIGSELDRKRNQPFDKIASGNVRAGLGRMFVGPSAAYMTSGMLQKSKNYNPEKEENKITRFVRQNPDILGTAVAMDGILSLHGGGTHGAWEKAKPAAKQLAKMIGHHLKVASAQDFVMDAMVWPLAFGGKGLSSRILGGLADQAILEGSKKILSKKKTQDKV